MNVVYTFLGDYYHNHDYILSSIEKAVDTLENVKIVDESTDNFIKGLQSTPSMIILGLENRKYTESKDTYNWFNPKHDDALEGYVREGGSLFVLHSALASYDVNSKYINMLKGYFISHPEKNCMVRYKAESVKEFDMSKFDFEIMDEHYNLKVDQNGTNVFMYSYSSEYGRNYGGWFHNYGKGKVICLALTHFKEGLEHNEVIKLYNKGIKWGLNK